MAKRFEETGLVSDQTSLSACSVNTYMPKHHRFEKAFETSQAPQFVAKIKNWIRLWHFMANFKILSSFTCLKNPNDTPINAFGSLTTLVGCWIARKICHQIWSFPMNHIFGWMGRQINKIVVYGDRKLIRDSRKTIASQKGTVWC